MYPSFRIAKKIFLTEKKIFLISSNFKSKQRTIFQRKYFYFIQFLEYRSIIFFFLVKILSFAFKYKSENLMQEIWNVNVELYFGENFKIYLFENKVLRKRENVIRGISRYFLLDDFRYEWNCNCTKGNMWIFIK